MHLSTNISITALRAFSRLTCLTIVVSALTCGLEASTPEQRTAYHIQEQPNALLGSNPANHMDFRISSDGFDLRPAHASTDWGFHLGLDKIHKGAAPLSLNANTTCRTGTEAIMDLGTVEVQYLNTAAGLRQNFILHQRPQGSDLLRLELSAKTALLASIQSETGMAFLDANGKTILRYEDLKVWDAMGTVLHAYMAPGHNGHFALVVDDREAVYPITVDPIATAYASKIEANQASANMGLAVSTAGDVNGDGYSDVLMASPFFDNGQTDEGVVYVFYGAATGIGTVPDLTLEMNQANARFGSSVATAGDVNGDGFSDVIIGASRYDLGSIDEGAAFVFHGSVTGLATTPSVTLESNQLFGYMGNSVTTIGDANNDGFSDIAVGVVGYDNGLTDEGAVFIYYGSAAGIPATVGLMLEGNQASCNFGQVVAAAGNVNGDDYFDLIVGAPLYDNGQTDEGRVYVYNGSGTGISATPSTTIENNTAAFNLGSAASSAGDMNGDSYSEIVIGSTTVSNTYLHAGTVSGTATAITSTISNTATSLAFGDFDGGGYSDVVVGNQAQSGSGRATIYFGTSPVGFSGQQVLNGDSQASSGFGFAVAGGGDYNGDGITDLLVGAPYYDNGSTDEGAVYCYNGGAGFFSNWEFRVNGFTLAEFGYYDGLSSAGDVNGDGFADVIQGGYGYSNGQPNEGAILIYHGTSTGLPATHTTLFESNLAYSQLGISVSTAGDINNDGYSDVIAGADYYSNGQSNEGGAYVFLGSPSGIITTPLAILESNMADAYFGQKVATAGDVNADGYADLLVAAPGYTNGQFYEGAVYLFLGGSGGPSATPTAIIEGNIANGSIGAEGMSSAGDVNGDGFGDIVIGYSSYSNGQFFEGAVFLYYGNATGINTTPVILESNSASIQFGKLAQGIGDVNGDGFGDFAATYSTYPELRVFHGSASGPIALSPYPYLGQAINDMCGMGDVNGDGYADLGMTSNNGNIRIYHGSPTGIGSTHNQSFTAPGLVYPGRNIANGGDINGDGFSDLLATDYGGDNNCGVLFSYISRNEKSNVVNPRQYQSNLTTPLITGASLTGAQSGVGLKTFSRNGKAQTKLVWEVRANSVPFSGTPTSGGVAFTGQGSAWSTPGLAGTELKELVAPAGVQNKIRVRQRFQPRNMIDGQVYSRWQYLGIHDYTLLSNLGGCAASAPSITGLAANYCSTASAVTMTGTPGGGTFSGPGVTGSTFNPATAGVGTHTITYSLTNPCAISSTASVTVVGNPAQPGTITGATNVCTGSIQAYSITAVPGATSYSWVLPSGWTGSSTTNAITATASATSGNITVTASNSCGTSSPQTLAVSVSPTPATPGSISGSNAVCASSTNTYTIVAVPGATSYTWSLPGGWSGTSTTNSITAVAGASGGTISVTASNTCGTSSAATLPVTIATQPAQPGTISGATTLCQSSTNIYSITAVPGATSYIWTLPGGWTGSSTTNSISAVAGANSGTITVSAVNGCGTSTSQTLAVTVSSLPAQPGSIAGNNVVCQSSSNTYSISTVPGATSYTWTLPSGWSGSSASTSITTSAGSNSGTITVTANNGCGSSTSQSLTVTANTVPTQPSAITGNSSVCPGNTVTYSVAPVVGATSYTWTLPGGSWTGSSNTNTITVTAGTTSGSISVTADNSCGNSPQQALTVTIASAPTQPGTITGSATVCANGSYSYSITPVVGASSYIWVLPSGWTGSSTSTSINATAGSSGNIEVATVNGCGTSTAQVLFVTSNPTPATPTISTSGPLTFCDGGSVTLISSAATGNTWSPGGQTTGTITVTTTGSYSVTATQAGCVSASSNAVTVLVSPVPPAPTVSPSGPIDFCQGGNVTLVSSASSGNVWNPGGQTSNSIVVTASGTYIAQQVQNGCTSAGSTPVVVTVHPLPTVSIFSPNDTVCSSAAPLNLSASPVGGTFSGAGTSSSGVFDPSAAGLGNQVVSYAFTDPFGCSNTATTVIVVEVCTATPDPAGAFPVTISPNPTRDLVHVEVGKAGVKQIRVLSMLGVEVMPAVQNSEALQTLDFSGLATGVYVVEVRMGKRLERVRVVRL